MTKDEFLLKFSLNTPAASLHQYKHDKPLKKAAVLIPLVDDGKQLNVLLTMRAAHLRHHAGQVSFPGGKVEDYDVNLADTATRETHEEIGLPTHLINIIGNLHTYQVISGFEVTPIVAFIPNNYNYTQDDNEVSEIFQVPLQHFIDNKNHISIQVNRKHISNKIHFIPYRHYNIWGATASMLKDLAAHLK